MMEKITVAAKAKKRSLIAWIIIVFLVLTAVATGANQTLQLFQNLGWMAKP